jgi:hypothetical protein
VDKVWKKVGEELNAQVKELAEKRAINTAKQLNEIHGAVRKEMNDKTWIYTRDMGALYREATAKIETLEAEVKGFKELLGTYDTILKGRNEEVERLEAELDNLALASHSDKDVAIRNDELRDQFACVALQGFYANPAMVEGFSEAQVAEMVYEQADAMLKVRERK